MENKRISTENPASGIMKNVLWHRRPPPPVCLARPAEGRSGGGTAETHSPGTDGHSIAVAEDVANGGITGAKAVS